LRMLSVASIRWLERLGYQHFDLGVANFGGDPPWLPQPILLCVGGIDL
jgi:hypothetical protein